MIQAPAIWFWLSGAFFVANIFLFIALGIAALKLVGILKELSPKIVAIEGQVQDLVKKVQELTANIQQTVSELGGKAKGVVGSAEGVAQSASRQFERYSPFVIGSLTAIRLVSALSKARQGSALAKAGSKTRKGVLAYLPKRKPKTLLGKVIQFVRR